MRAIVVYESMFGNTRLVANAIGRGLESFAETTVVPVSDADPTVVAGADLIVVGGPTHAHGMSRTGTRSTAASMANKPRSGLSLEPGATGVGVREWLATLGHLDVQAATFDTKVHGPGFVTGRASRSICRKLGHLGCHIVVPPESFLVSGKVTYLDAGEKARAEEWGRQLAGKAACYRLPVTRV